MLSVYKLPKAKKMEEYMAIYKTKYELIYIASE